MDNDASHPEQGIHCQPVPVPFGGAAQKAFRTIARIAGSL
jgi:hypothetical protein